LTKLGIEQAKKLSLRLKDEKISAIYSSDLTRASDTAKEIAKFHPNAKLFFVQELREKDQGSLSGKLIKEIDWSKSRDTEKSESMLKRAKTILEKAYTQYKGQTVIFVSHGGLICVLTALLMDKPLETIKKNGPSVNTAVSIFEIKDDNHYDVILINCGKHLE
ncbi:MAG: histidine phosphatase family protein, partial [bacterium]|nr:histidine phosphatase family protein [bacterium]